MAAWRCMICLVFVALTLKVLLSHINGIHGRSPDFWVYCGIDGCEQDFRVFNSFFRHIKRTHASYWRNGDPPSEWGKTPTSRSIGVEKFGVPVFGSCSGIITQTAVPNVTRLSPGPSQTETTQPQEGIAVSSKHTS